ncbi:hypothetical protein OSB04_026534 [Centaurea solstitialis]|uniref:Uncharacterized protein n=1 Tax=Centaurea solstitialis TaxID=347529 RepID=A0AA38SCV9_9ASTR|nr:hypothetical protein OSB04_026534 [Centaurea solstitialis]
MSVSLTEDDSAVTGYINISTFAPSMTTTTADVQIFPLCTCIECITNVERALCGIHGVRLLYVNHQNAKFTIETTRDPREIKDALQRMFVGTSVVVSRRINPPNSSVQRPLGFHDVVRELVEGPLGNGLANVEITESTTIRANYATNVHDSEDGGSGYANGAPPPTLLPPLQPRQYQPTTYGSARPYENVGGNGYDYVAPPSQPAPPPPQQYQPSTYGSTWPYERNGPPSDDYNNALSSNLPVMQLYQMHNKGRKDTLWNLGMAMGQSRPVPSNLPLPNNHRDRAFSHPEEIMGVLQHTFPKTSVTVSRRINTPNSSVHRPLDFHDAAREMVEGSRANELQNVEFTQSTTLRMNFTVQPTTSQSATNVHDFEMVVMDMLMRPHHHNDTK